MTCGRVLSVVGFLLIGAALAMPGFDVHRAAAAEDPADTAKAVLERHCARCHQAGRLNGRERPAAGFGSILNLEALAREPHFVVPGNPDGSRIYTMMLSRNMPYDVFHEGRSGDLPSAAEIAAIRRWIAGLEPPAETSCPARPVLDDDAIEAAIKDDRARLPASARDRARYISLAPQWNACVETTEIAIARQALALIVNAASRAETPRVPQPVGRDGVLLRIDLDEVGWSEADWETLLSVYPYRTRAVERASRSGEGGSAEPAAELLRGDWLAFAAADETRQRVSSSSRPTAAMRAAVAFFSSGDRGLSRLSREDAAAFTSKLKSAGVGTATTSAGVPARDALARGYTRDMSPREVAAELGIEFSSLTGRLGKGSQAAQRLLRWVRAGRIPRAIFEQTFEDVIAVVTNRTGVRGDKLGEEHLIPAPGIGRARIDISSDKAVYERGALASFEVVSQVDCNLTLVSVDGDGAATVLLPNDWDRTTFLPAGQVQRFPRKESPFRFRLDKPGLETIIAGCNPKGLTFDGIKHDFNLQKFTKLGDYDAYLDSVARGQPKTAEAGDRRRNRSRARFLRNRKITSDRRPAPDPTVRNAMRFVVR